MTLNEIEGALAIAAESLRRHGDRIAAGLVDAIRERRRVNRAGLMAMRTALVKYDIDAEPESDDPLTPIIPLLSVFAADADEEGDCDIGYRLWGEECGTTYNDVARFVEAKEPPK